MINMLIFGGGLHSCSSNDSSDNKETKASIYLPVYEEFTYGGKNSVDAVIEVYDAEGRNLEQRSAGKVYDVLNDNIASKLKHEYGSHVTIKDLTMGKKYFICAYFLPYDTGDTWTGAYTDTILVLNDTYKVLPKTFTYGVSKAFNREPWEYSIP